MNPLFSNNISQITNSSNNYISPNTSFQISGFTNTTQSFQCLNPPNSYFHQQRNKRGNSRKNPHAPTIIEGDRYIPWRGTNDMIGIEELYFNQFSIPSKKQKENRDSNTNANTNTNAQNEDSTERMQNSDSENSDNSFSKHTKTYNTMLTQNLMFEFDNDSCFSNQQDLGNAKVFNFNYKSSRDKNHSKNKKPNSNHKSNRIQGNNQNHANFPEEKKTVFQDVERIYEGTQKVLNFSKKKRRIPKHAEKILDAPGILDDYYVNLIDWSDSNLLGVCLSDKFFTWNAYSGEITEFMQTPSQNHLTSICFFDGGEYVALGTDCGKILIWNVPKIMPVLQFGGHSGRVASLAWNSKYDILTSGDRKGTISNFDLRTSFRQTNIRNVSRINAASRMDLHTEEVCGLKWSNDCTQLASGANDNLLSIWDINRMHEPLFLINEHNAAVKALAWSPYNYNVIASGGGIGDKTIKFFNTQTGICQTSINVNSQVCSLLWNPYYKEFISGHGFSKNQLTVWNYNSMTKVQDLCGHKERVLHMALSPDGNTICSASADETLRFWKLNTEDESKKHNKKRKNNKVKPRFVEGYDGNITMDQMEIQSLMGTSFVR